MMAMFFVFGLIAAIITIGGLWILAAAALEKQAGESSLEDRRKWR